MTHARHVKATGDPADLRALRVREALSSLDQAARRMMLTRIRWENATDRQTYESCYRAADKAERDYKAAYKDAKAACLEALEEAEQAEPTHADQRTP